MRIWQAKRRRAINSKEKWFYEQRFVVMDMHEILIAIAAESDNLIMDHMFF